MAYIVCPDPEDQESQEARYLSYQEALTAARRILGVRRLRYHRSPLFPDRGQEKSGSSTPAPGRGPGQR